MDPNLEDRAKPDNLLEWMRAKGLPDSARALAFALLITITLTPYLGGRLVSILGASVNLPTVSGWTYWLTVAIAPAIWIAMFARIIGAPMKHKALAAWGAVVTSSIALLLNAQLPAIGLSAAGANYSKRFQLGFQEVGHSWVAAHTADNKYCFFRTPPLDLGEHIRSGCTLRVQNVIVRAGGSTDISQAQYRQAAFDLEVFVSSSALLPEANECLAGERWREVKKRPKAAEVWGHTTIYVKDPEAMEAIRLETFSADYDFGGEEITAAPFEGPTTNLNREDITAGDDGVHAQVLGWTLWGDPVWFQMDALEVRITASLHCVPSVVKNLGGDILINRLSNAVNSLTGK